MESHQGKRPIFRSWITIHGVRYYAKEFGRKAWLIWVKK